MKIGAEHLAAVARALSVNGLILRGGFAFEAEENPPAAASGKPARSVALVGHAGAAQWPHFSKWLCRRDGQPENPLDTWSREVIGSVARQFAARAVFPSDRPYLPFQQWAARAERLKPSPLGILIHPEYGLWHAWRGALLFDEIIGFEPVGATAHPCDDCVEKPCLSACPVSAFSGNGYEVATCTRHVRGASGRNCREGGCLARKACPVGKSYQYASEVQAFHMAAFLDNHPVK